MTQAHNFGPDEIAFGPFRLIQSERRLLKNGEEVVIGSRALEILLVLVRKAGEVITQREIMEQVWPGITVEESSVRVHVAALRKALGDGRDEARYVTNVPGRGYCFVAPTRAFVEPSSPDAPALPAKRTNLPPKLSRMIGRAETVDDINSLLEVNRFVSIVGPGGMGKTTVAVAVAHSLAEKFDDAVHFVDLGSIHDEALLGPAIASAAGCPVQSHDPLEALVSFIGNNNVLLVIDNCEHLIEGVATAVEQLFAGAANLHILTTSREALRAGGEHVYLLEPLGGPHGSENLTAADALASPAVQLFMERASASGHRIPLNDNDARTVANICSRLDGIALAIELAASRVGTHGINGTADLLDNRFRFLWHGRRTALPRHQTLHAMLDWSFNLLSETEQTTLCSLAIFVGNFTLDSALAVAASPHIETRETEEAFASLVAKSLIWVSHREGTTLYRLLDTTRTYASGKLIERGTFNETARRHATYFAYFDASNAQSHSAASNLDTLHLDDVRAALAWSFSEVGDQTVGIELTLQSAPLFFKLSLLRECRHWAEHALSQLPDAHRGTERELILLEASAMSSMFTEGNTEEVRHAIERALILAETLGSGRRELRLLAGLNVFATRTGAFLWAVEIAQRAMQLCKQTGTSADVAIAEWMVGVSQNLLGDQAAAQHHCERGFEIAARSGSNLDAYYFGYDHRIRAQAALARTRWLRGQPDQATAMANRAIQDATASDHPIDVCLAYIYTIPVFLWTGDFNRAETHIESLTTYANRYSFAPYRAIGNALKGELAVCRGDPATGAELLRKSLAELSAGRHLTLVVTFSRTLAEAVASAGVTDDALAIIRGATASALERGGTFDLPDLLRVEGQILLQSGSRDVTASEKALGRAIEAARRQSALGWELRATISMTRLWGQSGRVAKAHAILSAILDQFTEGFETADLIEGRNLLAQLESN